MSRNMNTRSSSTGLWYLPEKKVAIAPWPIMRRSMSTKFRTRVTPSMMTTSSTTNLEVRGGAGIQGARTSWRAGITRSATSVKYRVLIAR